ncbi:MAG TPA: TIGR02186 family protein [Stellaceae bacterium]|nr:TIGR02186 family protein [Stellaceae bacterium]
MLAALSVVVGLVPAARAEPSLSADLSAHQITLGADAAARSVTLFGTIDAPGDLVVVVRGPDAEAVVRRGPFGDFWLTAHHIAFAGVPDYYAVYASGPLDAIVPPEIQRLHQIGLANLRFQVQPPPPDATLVDAARLALIAQRQTAGVYASTVGKVGFVNSHLFRATLVFPADASAGTYFIEALLFRDKALAGGQTMSLTVAQAGGGTVADPAGPSPLLYAGLGALAATVAATGVFVARRRRAPVKRRPQAPRRPAQRSRR